METVKIILSDGTEIEAEVNGNNYITDSKPDFPEDMTEVTIDGEVLENVVLQECAPVDSRYWFTFVKVSDFDLLKSQVLYTALMTDTMEG